MPSCPGTGLTTNSRHTSPPALSLRTVGVPRLGPLRGQPHCRSAPGALVVPDQLVDRTSGRPATYFDSGAVHVGFADPYCPQLRAVAARRPAVVDGGTMVVIEGPRFSTRAESQWYARQGFTLVNMTGHPEAVLARELEMCYAAIALVTDLDAGIEAGSGVNAVEVFAEFERNLVSLKKLLRDTLAAVPAQRTCTHCLPHKGVALPFRAALKVCADRPDSA